MDDDDNPFGTGQEPDNTARIVALILIAFVVTLIILNVRQ